jgi:DNA polymerase bacteriophage-type
MTILHMDFESYSECDLKDAGVYRYAEHPSTEITACSYAFGDGQTCLWIPYANVPRGVISAVQEQRPDACVFFMDSCPPAIEQHILARKEIRAHNAQFERVISNGVAGKKLGIPEITIEQTMCTAAKMAASGLPRGLGDAAKALGTPLKDDAGRISMLQIAKPRKPTKDDPSTRWTFENAPEKWIAMLVYNIDDTPAERGIDNAVPDLIDSEREIYHLDQRINQRGIAVDLEAVQNILHVVEQYKSFLAAECETATANWLGEGLKPTQREKIADWARENGFPGLVDMTADYIQTVIKGDVCPENVKRVLLIYSTYNAKSVSKYSSIQDAVCADGRLRGMFLYHGAGPGRWSSLIVQLQNTMRPLIKDPETALEAFKERDYALIQFLYPDLDLMKVAGSCVRSVLVAGSGKNLCYVDFVGIEARVNPWFFDEEWMLEVFRAQDNGTGPDSYKAAYCSLFNSKIEDVDWTTIDGMLKRQIGKVTELFFNYEGGVGAFLTGAETYGIDLDAVTEAAWPQLSDEAKSHGEWMVKNHRQHDVPERTQIALDGIKFTWRSRRPKTKQGWKDLKEAAELAVQNPGKAYSIPQNRIAFKVVEYKGRYWLKMRLPSGRCISYYNPRWIEAKIGERWLNNVLTEYTIPGEMRYWGLDTKTRQWIEQATYGGKLDENADQGYASCLLRQGLRNLEAAGYEVVGSVHDEGITEVPFGFGSVKEAGELMCKQEAHAAGLPLAVSGKLQPRYGK